jgi:tetratricopeptide (TPR) repeat protein
MVATPLSKRYQIVQLLRTGRFTKTYRAEDKNLPTHPPCLIREVEVPGTPGQSVRNAFEAQARLLAQLGGHDRIPQLLASFEIEQKFYTVEEWIEGESLNQILDRAQRLTGAEVIVFLRQVLETLQFTHQHNGLHQNIKPTKLIRRQADQQWMLTGFWSIRQLLWIEPGSGHSLAFSDYSPDLPLGDYLHPVFNQDLYSLGMTAVHALTGRPPKTFPHDPKTGAMLWHPLMPQKGGLAAIIDRLISRSPNPADRYSTATEALEDLSKLEQAIAPPSVSRPPDGQRGLGWQAGSQAKYFQPIPFLWVLVAIGLLSGLGYLAYLGYTQCPDLFDFPQLNLPLDSAIAYYVERGEKQFEQKQYQSALADFEAAIKLDPKLAKAWVGKGRVLAALERYEEAVKNYDQALKLNPDDPSVWLAKSGVFLRLQRFEASLMALDKALELRPDDPNLLINQASLLRFVGRYEESLAACDQAIAINPNLSFAWSNRAEALDALERYEEAVTAYDKSLSLGKNPHNWPSQDQAHNWASQAEPHIWASRAEALKQLNRYDEALASYDRAIALAPNAVFWDAKGYVLYAANRFDEAIQAFDESLKLDDTYVTSWIGKGLTYAKQDRYEEGLKALDRALELQPDLDFAGVLVLRGNMLNTLGRHEAALASAEKALSLPPETLQEQSQISGTGIKSQALSVKSDALLKLGQVQTAFEVANAALAAKLYDSDQEKALSSRANALVELGRLDEALVDAQNRAEVSLDNEYAWSGLSQILTRLRRYDEALDAANRSLDIRPELRGWYRQGIALAGLGRHQEAIAAFDKAIAIKADYHYAWVGKGSALYQLGQYEAAIAAYDKALAIEPGDRRLQEMSDHFNTWNQKGNALFQLKRFDQALAAYQASIKIKSDFADAWFNQCRVLDQLQRGDEAIAACDEALIINPNLTKAKTLRDTIRSRRGGS